MAKNSRPRPPSQDVVNPTSVEPPELPGVQAKIRMSVQQWSGPLPHPAELEHYNQLVEGGAERIFRQFETEADHRRSEEARESSRNFVRDLLAQGSAAVFSLSGLGLAYYSLEKGSPRIAFAIVSTTIGMVVVSFLRFRMKKPENGNGHPPQSSPGGRRPR